MVEAIKENSVYEKRDFIYNNGLVNAFMYLEGDKNTEVIDEYMVKWNGIQIELKDDSLVFYTSENNMVDIYKFLIGKYYEEIMETTENKRLYVTDNLTDIIESSKVNKKPFAGRVKIDKLQNIYGVKEVDSENFIRLANIYWKKTKSGILKTKNGKFWHGESNKNLEILVKEAKEGYTKKVVIYHPINEIKKILSNYVTSVEKTKKYCSICGSSYTTLITKDGKKDIIIESQNLIYDFGNSTPINRDHRMKYEQPICFMCDMFYRLGVINNYFYNTSVFMFDSYSLRILKKIKNRLGINNNYKVVEKSKTKTNIEGTLNIPVHDSHSQIFGIIYHIYKKTKNREKLIYDIGSSVLIKLDISSEAVNNSIFYNKLSKVFQIFRELEKEKLCCERDSFMSKFMYYHYFSRKDRKEYPKIYEDLSYKLLYFLPVEDSIFEASYSHLSKEKEGGRNLKDFRNIRKFLKIYMIIKGGKNMEEYNKIIDKCAALGEKIGSYAADVEEKNLIYQIREIGNIEKIVEFFRDFEYSVLKNDRGDVLNTKDTVTGEKYSELITDILKIAADKKHLYLIRDLLGIFAVQKYLTVKYAKSQGGD